MNKFIGRASAAMLAALLMAGAPEAALAQKGSKAPSFKFSKPVQSLLAQAQKAQQGNDHAGAVALLQQADALPNKNADDAYMINMLTLNSAINLKDNALLEKALEGALASERLPAEERPKFIRNLGAMALQRNDTPAALAQFERLLALTPNDSQLMVEVAELYRRQNQPKMAIEKINKAIAASETNGAKADEQWYRRALAIAYDGKLGAETIATGEALLKAHPNPTNWRDVLLIYRDSTKIDDQTNLDVMRLMRLNGALAGERDFVEYADTATIRGLPGEAKAVLDEGIAKGALQAAKPVVRDLLAQVNPKIAADKASLAGLAKEAATSKNGRLAYATGDAFLGYGDYAKAADMYRLAIQKGSVDVAAANTRLGHALAKAGDKAGAEAALKAVSGAPRDQLARYYQVWLASQS